MPLSSTASPTVAFGQIGTLPFLVARFGASRLLSVSRDGRWALVSHIDNWPRDIAVADNVR